MLEVRIELVNNYNRKNLKGGGFWLYFTVEAGVSIKVFWISGVSTKRLWIYFIRHHSSFTNLKKIK